MLILSRYAGNVAAMGGYDADATAWKAAVVAAGGTVSDARFSLVATLIGSLKSASVWTLLDRLWLLAAENSQSALIDLVARSSATAVNSPTFTVDRGYAGNGTTSYVDTGYNPNTNKVSLSLNSAHLAFYTNVLGSVDSGGTAASAGGGDASGHLHMHGPFSDGKMYARINQPNSGGGRGSALTTGMYIGDRTGSNAVVNARNGADLGTDAIASTGTPAVSLYVGRLNFSTATFNASRFAMMSVGGSLGSSGRSALASTVNSHMTSIGANVY